jgi:hypothetical protein
MLLFLFNFLKSQINLLLMETIKDFFGELKERASNPLVSSYVIAWLIFNWPITIGILFYSQEELQLDGVRSYVDLVSRNSSIWLNLVLPAIFALAYTFVFPYVKAVVKLYHAKISAKNESDILKATKDGMMPVKKYIELRDTQNLVTTQLRELIDSQSTIHNLNTELTTKLSEESNRYNELAAENAKNLKTLDIYYIYTQAGILDGKWNFIVTVNDQLQATEQWEFSSGTLKVNDGNIFRVRNMVTNNLSKSIAFQLYNIDGDNRRSAKTYFFHYDNDFQTLIDQSEDPVLTLVRETPTI